MEVATKMPEQLIEELGLTRELKHVPNKPNKPDIPLKELQIHWKVKILRNGREIIETDYHEGIGHLKGYKFNLRDTIHNCDQVRYACDHYGKSNLPSGNPYSIVPPTLKDILYCLVQDSDVINYRDFEDWADNIGYNPDSRKDEKIYQACMKIALTLSNSLGHAAMDNLREAYQDY